ncbi:MAG: hypothetical protein M1834_004779 [Cirrosporium novae-zelandiae]|nr:MAG: hypothetical protein M1834_004779 [Cirrosporium novae-zelandiae]
MPPLITLEEHFVSPTVRDAVKDQDFTRKISKVSKQLECLSSERVQDMDNGNILIQVVSHSASRGDIPVDLCRKANDELYQACKDSNGRLVGWAMLPMHDPPYATDELVRCVKNLGFVGAMIDNKCRGSFYDDISFWPIFERAVELKVPIYLHPSLSGEDMAEHYKGNFPNSAAYSMSTAGIGWHQEVGLHVLRLFASGLFDAYPRLQIIIGHMGEMLPCQLDHIVGMTSTWGLNLTRGLRQVWNENILVTTSGMFSMTPMTCLLRSTRIDRIMYSVDYPFSSNETGLKFMEELRKSGLVTEEEFDMIAHRNAERVLKLNKNKKKHWVT